MDDGPRDCAVIKKGLKMKVTIDWKIGFGNDPIAEVHMNSPKEGWLWVGHESGNCMVWVAEHECGLVRGFFENPRDRSGFGGSTFSLPTATGVVKVKGPWMGSSDTYRKYTSSRCIEVVLIHDNGAREASLMLISTLRDNLPEGVSINTRGVIHHNELTKEEMIAMGLIPEKVFEPNSLWQGEDDPFADIVY